VRRPAVCAVTPISFDHPDFLGNTVERIAAEKAGILKPGVPAVVGPQPLNAAAVLERRAAEIGTTLRRHGHEWHAEPSAGGFRYRGKSTIELPLPALPGRHQIDNAGLAVAATEHIAGFAITPAHLAAGLLR